MIGVAREVFVDLISPVIFTRIVHTFSKRNVFEWNNIGFVAVDANSIDLPLFD